MERKCVPEQRQRFHRTNRRPHHRRARLGRHLWTGRALLISASGQNAAEHDRLADEWNPGETSASVTRRFADENRVRMQLIERVEIAPQISAANRTAVLIERAIGKPRG